jgi:hypothetical protein
MTNIIFSLSKLQAMLHNLQKTVQTNYKQKSILENKGNKNQYECGKNITKEMTCKMK